MLTSKKMTLKPLLESEQGVHLTAYLVNRGDLEDLKTQLRESIQQAQEWLHSNMSQDEIEKFFEPLESLLSDGRIFRQMKGNIGIFRNQDSFRLLNVPVEIEQTCLVATSFHVKPLLKWLQADQEFLLLGLEKDCAHLYVGSQDSFKFIDSILFPDVMKMQTSTPGYLPLKKAKQIKIKTEETFTWLNDWIAQLTTSMKPKLFLAGDPALIESLKRHLKYKNVVKIAVADTFGQQNAAEVCSRVREILRKDSADSIEKTLQEFRLADEGQRVRKNIFQISKAVVQGRVRKLIVTDELNIFGKIDKKSGGLAIHPFDLDHEDDDILDDLAQMVLSQGGEVIVASRGEIPKGRPILAILDDEGKELEKAHEVRKYEILR